MASPPSSSRQPAPSGQGYESKPFEVQITAVNRESEQAQVDSAIGPDSVQIPHALLSPNSWMRGAPEKGARLLVMASASSSMRRAPLGYYSRSATELIKRYNQGQGLYRPLEDGTFELMSIRVASVSAEADGCLRLRGGVVHGDLDPVRMRHRMRAPTHVRELHQHKESDIGDEERFGIVVRNLSTEKRNRWLRPPGSTETDTEAGFAKEYLRVFGRAGKRLALVQEGDLFDATGKPIKAFTGKNSRSVRELYDASGGVCLQREVDEAGSIKVQSTGTKIDVGAPQAQTTVSLQQLQVQISQLLSLTAGTTAAIEAQTTATLSGTTGTLLGPGPIHESAVKGMTLVSTVLTPLLTALALHFECASKPPPAGPLDFLTYQPLMAAIAVTLRTFISAAQASLSLNVRLC